MGPTRVLVAYASKMGSTAEIAGWIGERLRERDYAVDVTTVEGVRNVNDYETVVIGSAVYMLRWRPEAVRFLKRCAAELTGANVWVFQSGSIDDSAERKEIALPKKVARLTRAVGAHPHVTFGGRLRPDAEGFMASKMARNAAGDHRDRARIRGWADEIADALSPAPDYTSTG